MAISEAVKKAASGCKHFVGVIVLRKTPKSLSIQIGQFGE